MPDQTPAGGRDRVAESVERALRFVGPSERATLPVADEQAVDEESINS